MIALLLSMLASFNGHPLHAESVRGLVAQPNGLRAFAADHARHAQSVRGLAVAQPQSLRVSN